MDWVRDPLDDVELVRDIERVRNVGTEKDKQSSQTVLWGTCYLGGFRGNNLLKEFFSFPSAPKIRHC